jgi:hypothetical protein
MNYLATHSHSAHSKIQLTLQGLVSRILKHDLKTQHALLTSSLFLLFAASLLLPSFIKKYWMHQKGG